MSVYLTSVKTEFDSGLDLLTVRNHTIDSAGVFVTTRAPRVKVELELKGSLDRDEYDAIIKCLRDSLNDKYIDKSSL